MLAYMSIVWLVLLILFVVVEALTAGLVSVWFIVGSIAALVVSFFGASLGIQIAVFFVVSIVALIVLRPIATKRLKKDRVPTSSERYIGRTGIVIKDINNLLGEGRITIDGLPWAAVSKNDEIIEKDATVRILSLSGVKFTVEKI